MFEVLFDLFLLIFSYLAIIYSIHRWVSLHEVEKFLVSTTFQAPHQEMDKDNGVEAESLSLEEAPRSGIDQLSAGFYGDHVPEDHALRRHFVAYISSMLDELHGVKAPEEAVLLRHHRQWLEAKREACLEDKHSFDVLIDEYLDAKRDNLVDSERIDSSVSKANLDGYGISQTTTLPTDSILKRHYRSERLRLIVESEIEKPTAFDLLRHYEQLINRKLEEDLGWSPDLLHRAA